MHRDTNGWEQFDIPADLPAELQRPSPLVQTIKKGAGRIHNQVQTLLHREA